MIAARHHGAPAGGRRRPRRSPPNRSRPRPARPPPPRRTRITRTIIGSPPISASGLPGRRVDAMRAGIRIRTLESMDNCRLGGGLFGGGKPGRRLSYTGCQPGGKPAMCLRRTGAAPAPIPKPKTLPSGAEPQWTPSNSTRSWALCCSPACACCRSTSRPGPCSRRCKPAKPGFEVAVQEQATQGGAPAGRAG